MRLSLQDAITHEESKAAGVFPADLARLLCSATVEDWQVIRWIKAPPSEKFLGELNELGKQLLLIT